MPRLDRLNPATREAKQGTCSGEIVVVTTIPPIPAFIHLSANFSAASKSLVQSSCRSHYLAKRKTSGASA